MSTVYSQAFSNCGACCAMCLMLLPARPEFPVIEMQGNVAGMPLVWHDAFFQEKPFEGFRDDLPFLLLRKELQLRVSQAASLPVRGKRPGVCHRFSESVLKEVLQCAVDIRTPEVNGLTGFAVEQFCLLCCFMYHHFPLSKLISTLQKLLLGCQASHAARRFRRLWSRLTTFSGAAVPASAVVSGGVSTIPACLRMNAAIRSTVAWRDFNSC